MGNLKMLVNLVVRMDIIANVDCYPGIRHFDIHTMPRLYRNWRVVYVKSKDLIGIQ